MMKRFSLLISTVALLAGCAVQPATSPPTVQSVAPDRSPKAAVNAPNASATAPEKNAWPRQVMDAEGKMVEIKAKPMRIHTLSVGYDEITMRLVGVERFAAVGTVTVNPLYSNISELASQVPMKVGRKSEDVLAAQPDLLVASPFANKDLVQQLKGAGITVVVSDLQSSIEGHERNIRFLAYLYGEEEEGESLIKEVNERLDRLQAVVGKKPKEQRPLVISLSDKLNTPGKGTTMDGIIQRAGGINAAAEAGIDQWQQISLETVVAMKPDVILTTDALPGKPDFGKEILAHPSLQNVPAIKNRQVYSLPGPLISTLSHWNVQGAEELAKLLWPSDF